MAQVFYAGNDMSWRLDKLRSSTMASGSYLTNSTGVSLTLWSGASTSTGTVAVPATNMAYSTESDSTGTYTATIQSTEHGLTVGTVGFALITVEHGDLDAEWRPYFRVEYRRVT
jgi:hypothetical protein